MRQVIFKDKWILYDNGTVYSIKKHKFLTGCIDRNGYVYVNLDKRYRLHKLIATYFVLNTNPQEFNVIDHINRNKLDNRSENLKWVSQKLNCRNRNDNPNYINVETNEKYYSRVEAAEKLGTYPEYIPTLVKKGKLIRI